MIDNQKLQHFPPKKRKIKAQMPASTTDIVEVWVEFGLSCLITILRMGIRIRAVGYRKLQGHDYLAVLVLVIKYFPKTLLLLAW